MMYKRAAMSVYVWSHICYWTVAASCWNCPTYGYNHCCC